MEAAILSHPATEADALQSPQAVVIVMKGDPSDERECLWVLHLDRENQLLEKEQVKTGFTVLPVGAAREILRKAVTNGSTRVITVRVPSNGTAELALEDIQFWRTLEIACEHLGIGFIDHLVVSTSGAHVSCRQTIRTSYRKDKDGYQVKQGRTR
jgi:DNA repair protein RadC